MPAPKAIADMRALGVLAPQSGDTQPPSIPLNVVATAINAGRVDLSWTASTDNFGVSGYQLYRNNSPLTVVTAATTYSDTTCQPSTAYSYTIVAFDSAGNNSQQSNAAVVTTPANASPVWQSIPTQTVIVGNAYLLQLTSYCTDADLDSLTFSVVTGTLPTGLALAIDRIQGTPTTAGQSPTVTIQAADQFHQISTTIAFAIKSADVTAPPVPTGLAATAVSTSQINLSWNASTDVAGSGSEYVSGTQDYRLYRSTDGVSYSLRTTLTGTTYSDTGLSSGTQYYYKVTSRDVALNESAQSSAATATTNSVAFNPTYPRLGSYAIGGTQNYENSSVQTALAKRHVNIVAHYPGWQNSRGTTMAAIMQAVKAASVIGTKFFEYMIYSEIAKANASTGQALWEPYQYINTNKLFAYTNGLTETGPLDADAGPSIAKVNYTLGAKLVASKRLYQYFIDWYTGVHKDGATVSNGTTNLTAAVNPYVDGLFYDNLFYRERTNADYNRDGTVDGLAPVGSMQAIQNAHLAAINYYRAHASWTGAPLLVNSADWREYETSGGYGSFSTSVLYQTVEGGAIESILNYETLAFSSMMSAIKTQMDAYKTPKLGILGWLLASFTDYQMMRYGLGVALLTDAYYYPYVSNYLSQDLPSLWYDEFDFSLGTATDPVQTAARYQAGTNGEGVWRRDFANGIVLVGARRSDGSTTAYSSVSLGGTFYCLTGSQAPPVNNGATVTAVTLSPRDAIVLSRTPSDPYAFRAPLSTDLYFDPTLASDGSGTSASPWNNLTLARWRSLAPGQALWLMNAGGNGSYSPIDLTSMPAGNSSNRITVAVYPGHTAQNWNFSGKGRGFVLSYWDFRGINILTNEDGICLGGNNWNGNQIAEGNCDHVRFIDCTGTKTSNGFTDNSGLICAAYESTYKAQFIDIIRCRFTGPTGQSNNQSLIWFDYMRDFNIIGCLLDGCANPIYFKHTDQTADANQNGVVKNCIIRRGGLGMRAAMNWVQYINCAFDACTLGMDEEGGGLPGGNDCTISHCTFLNSDWFMGLDASGARQRTTALNNVMLGTSRWKDAPFSSTDGGNLIDYTATDTAARYYRNSSLRTMAAYKSTYATQEIHGVTGTIALVGGSAPGATAANWALATGSVGIGTASDGGNRGVDATKLLTVN